MELCNDYVTERFITVRRTLPFVLTIIVHWVTTIVVQCGFYMRLWFHDYSTWNLFIWTLAGVFLACVDYRVCIQLATRGRCVKYDIVHLLDLLLAFPSLVVWGICFFEELTDGMLHKFSDYEIVWIVGIVLVDACFVLERIKLIRKN